MLNEHQAAAVGFTFPNPEPITPTLLMQPIADMQLVGIPPIEFGRAGTPRHISTSSKAVAKPRCSIHRCN
jgi:hypothetical protein